jgi:short-subunit dehydrogenase
MRQLRGRVALVTGASGGLGMHIARALAGEGMDVVVSGRREDALATVVGELCSLGVRAEAVPADLSRLEQVDGLVARAEQTLGPVDLLVNNAGVEIAAQFTDITREELASMVDVNLTAAMMLTHQVLPGMLDRGRGHVVFISSAAGKLGPAYQAPYAATKAAMVGLTQALRAEYSDAPVGFSVVCPGFVAGDGMYQRMVEHGFRANRLVGETTLEKVISGVVDAIRRDRPEVIEIGTPARPVFALNQLAPRLVEKLINRFGTKQMFREVAADRGRTNHA